jgi:murein DD-endopeptidase MepM/ murein hydrolase activator NlpD
MQRVNYIGSDKTIDISAEFAIANAGASEILSDMEVANAILINSDFTLKYAYGFFVNGHCYGAILEEDIEIVRNAIQSHLNKFTTGESDEDVVFLDHVFVGAYERFLTESVVTPEEIIAMINPETLPVVVTRTEQYEIPTDYETIYQPNDRLFEGNTELSRQGVQGTNRITSRVTYQNGVEVRRSPIANDVVTEPTSRIIYNGTRPRGDIAVSNQVVDPGMFKWPVITHDGNPAGQITSGQHFSSGHPGIDIAGSGLRNTPIIAAGSGTVTEVEWRTGGYGHFIVIEHENGMKTLYSHLNQMIVSIGQHVSQGEQIGTLGSTGLAQGPHLHFEVIDTNGRRVNPMNFTSRN